MKISTHDRVAVYGAEVNSLLQDGRLLGVSKSALAPEREMALREIQRSGRAMSKQEADEIAQIGTGFLKKLDAAS